MKLIRNFYQLLFQQFFLSIQLSCHNFQLHNINSSSSRFRVLFTELTSCLLVSSRHFQTLLFCASKLEVVSAIKIVAISPNRRRGSLCRYQAPAAYLKCDPYLRRSNNFAFEVERQTLKFVDSLEFTRGAEKMAQEIFCHQNFGAGSSGALIVRLISTQVRKVLLVCRV